MNWFSHLVGTAVALALIAGAFVYIFNPQGIEKLLKKFLILVLALMLLPAVIGQVLRSADPVAVFLILLVASVVAYGVRERRLRPPGRPQTLGRAERTPLLPKEEE